MQGKKIVLPGQVIGKKEKNCINGYGTFTNNGNIISKHVGFVQKRNKFINVVPFKKVYIPKVGDTVIGKVVEKNVVLWILDINSPYTATLRPSDTFSNRKNRGNRRRSNRVIKDTRKFEVGDLLIARIKAFNGILDPSLTTIGSPALGRIKKGIIKEFAINKISALIGNGGSMIKMLKKMLSCDLFIADNGIVLIQGKNARSEQLTIDTINEIEENAFRDGLREYIKKKIISKNK